MRAWSRIRFAPVSLQVKVTGPPPSGSYCLPLRSLSSFIGYREPGPASYKENIPKKKTFRDWSDSLGAPSLLPPLTFPFASTGEFLWTFSLANHFPPACVRNRVICICYVGHSAVPAVATFVSLSFAYSCVHILELCLVLLTPGFKNLKSIGFALHLAYSG